MPRTKDQAARGVGNNRDMGKDTPSYKGASIKGLTSKDPANVARNRAGAAKYSSVKDRVATATKDSNTDKAAVQVASRAASSNPAAKARAEALKTSAKKAAAATPTTTPRLSMKATKAPAGYRPGVDPEYDYRTGDSAAPKTSTAPRRAKVEEKPFVRPELTITLAKGGKAMRKKK